MDLVLPEYRAIPIPSTNVRILETPKEFYDFLIERSRSAKNRIALSTLYLGDGSLERGLVDSIDYNLKRNENLHVTVLLDYLRGTRGVAQEKSSTTLLKAIADRAAVYLYHTPKLTGLVKRVLPERTNEIVGLQHMKLYIFDDSVLISSFVEYRDLLRSRIAKVIDALQTQQASAQRNSSDTLLYPLVQMGLFGYHEEYELLKRLLSSKDSTTSITMASGYFNCIKEYEQLIFSEGKYSMDIVTAAPKANGFFGAAGPSGYIPSMYSWVCERILQMKEKYGRNDVNLYEYHRDGWTFHAKGLWVDTPAQTATLVGSSNFGYRSVHRDLEAQILLVTSNERLRSQLKDERRRLFDFASLLDGAALRRADHHIPVVVRVVSRIIRNFF
ncbi:hypothetical protein Aduo_015015 [Ancylostoma duodenale]